MLLFRSEEHIDAWYGRRGVAAGTVLTLNQQWEVARIWYSDLMSRIGDSGCPKKPKRCSRASG